MNNRASCVANVDVGTPLERQRLDFENEESVKVHFHGFANLPTRNEAKSPEFACLGHPWILTIVPLVIGADGKERVSVRLQHMSDESISISYSFSVRNSAGKQLAHYFSKQNVFSSRVGHYVSGNIFGKRTTLMTALRRGTLTIEVQMRTTRSSSYSSAAEFIPQNPLRQNILQLLGDEDFADVVFRVEGQVSRENSKRAKTSSVNFHAHQNILQLGAPELARMCRPGGSDGAASVPILIPGVKADIFRTVLYYVYGGKVSDEDLGENAKDLIQAADKFGVLSLKLEAELHYVKSTEITVGNVIDNFMYADSMNCALLKEATTDFVVKNKDDILGSVSFDDVPGSAVTDLLAAMARGERNVDGAGDRTNFNAMRVGTLRSMLHEKGLDVDGSREAMIAMLKQNLSPSSSSSSSPTPS